MKLQNEAMIRLHTSDEDEIRGALELGKLLSPCIEVNRLSGRVETAYGSKTLLGLYRTIKAQVYDKQTPATSP